MQSLKHNSKQTKEMQQTVNDRKENIDKALWMLRRNRGVKGARICRNQKMENNDFQL